MNVIKLCILFKIVITKACKIAIISFIIVQFDTKKLDDGEVAAEVRGKFIAELKNMQYKLLSTLQSYNIYLDKYEVWMQSSINNAAPYFEDDELQELHKEKKNEALTQVLI